MWVTVCARLDKDFSHMASVGGLSGFSGIAKRFALYEGMVL